MIGNSKYNSFSSSRVLAQLILWAVALQSACHTGSAKQPRPNAERAPVSVQIKAHGDRPTIFVNGKPETPMIYTITDSPGGQWSWDEFPQWNIHNFSKAGYNIIQFSLWLQDIWKPDGSLDMELVQRQFAGALKAAPNAVVMLRLHINAPFWWNDANPNETVAFADMEAKGHKPPWGIRRHTTDEDDLAGGKMHSLASLKWRTDTSAALQKLFTQLAAMPEGNALGFVNVCTGVSHEWHNWSFIKHDPDTSAPMTAYFRAWLKKTYANDAALAKAWANPKATIETAVVPNSDQRNHTDDGVFRNPATERYVMDYFHAQHEVVADDIIHFDGLIKKTWPRPIALGNFYGYYFMTFSRQTTGGHLAVDRILRAPEVDFLAAPQSYYSPAHNMGGSGQSRAIQDSARLHGKLVLDEMDQFTSMKHPFDNPAEDKRQDDIAIIRRNTLGPLSRGMGMWFYDFGPNNQTGWWAHPDFTEQARLMKQLFDDRVSKPLSPQADVLMVWDVESYYNVAVGWTPVSETSMDAVSNAVHKSGSVADDIFFGDLADVKLEPYKVVVIANAWRLNAQQRELIKTRVATQGRHVVFAYMPGYSDGGKNSFELVSDVTGITIAKGQPQGLAEITINNKVFAGENFGIPHNTVLSPFPVIKDSKATALGTFKQGGMVSFAKKTRSDGGTTWYSALPITSSRTWRELFRQAGAHVYQDADDALHSGNGVLWIHTATGGDRKLTLRNGKQLELKLAPKSTTVLDNETGVALMPNAR
jgi:hypothetical protein